MFLRHLADVKGDLDVQHQVIGRDGVWNLLGVAVERSRVVRKAKSELLQQEVFEALERIRFVPDFLSAELLKLAVHIVPAERDVGGGKPPVPLAGLLQPPLDGYFVIVIFFRSSIATPY